MAYSSYRKKRKPRRGPRKSRAKPKTGWSLAALASLGGVTPRTLRLYLERGVVPRPKFLGSATRYERRQLLWLTAARRLRTAERLELDQIRTRLQAMTAPELEAFAIADLPAGPVAQALGVVPTRADASNQRPAVNASPEKRWTRLELAVGLEMHVRDDVTPRVRELAAKVWELCVGPATEAAPAPPPPPVEP